MNLDLVDTISYLSLGLIVYYFLIELAKPKKGAQKIVTLLFIGIIVLFIGYFIWLMYNKKSKKEKIAIDEFEDIDNEDETEELKEFQPIPDFVQDNYIEQSKDFNIINQPINTNSQITSEDFKIWYLSPDFLSKYTNAIKQGYQIKKRKLVEVKKKYLADLNAIKPPNLSKDGISNILSSLERNDDAKMLENTINEIDSLLKQIKSKEDNLNLDTVRLGLISAFTDRNNGIDSLTGRDDIKDFLALQLYTFAHNPRIFFSNFQNMAIYGPSGVGKTKLAQVIGHVYASSGILVRNHVHVITKQSMTTAYVNESAKMTRKLLLANLESIVFIDEAYDMTPPPSLLGNSIDHGHEAITEMVNFIDKMKGLSIIIVAGYEKEMKERFMKANEGLPRRFPHKLLLKPYEPKQLTQILINFLLSTCPDINFTERHGNYLYTVINYINKSHPKIFKNQAGSMENLSGFIARSIYGNPGKSWDHDYEEIMLIGINNYLAGRGVSLEQID